MSSAKLNVIKPNNITARVFLRAARLRFTEDDVYGMMPTLNLRARSAVAYVKSPDK